MQIRIILYRSDTAPQNPISGIGRCSLMPTYHWLQGKCTKINLSQAASCIIFKNRSRLPVGISMSLCRAKFFCYLNCFVFKFFFPFSFTSKELLWWRESSRRSPWTTTRGRTWSSSSTRWTSPSSAPQRSSQSQTGLGFYNFLWYDRYGIQCDYLSFMKQPKSA